MQKLQSFGERNCGIEPFRNKAKYSGIQLKHEMQNHHMSVFSEFHKQPSNQHPNLYFIKDVHVKSECPFMTLKFFN